jgi:hypothetical protein
MNSYQVIGFQEAFVSSMTDLWNAFVSIIPNVVWGILILVFGLIAAMLLARLARWIVSHVKMDLLFEKTKITSKFEEIGFRFVPSEVIGWIVKWFIIIATFMTVTDILKLQAITEFLKQIVLYIPNVIIAILILVVGLIIGDLIRQFVKKSLQASHLSEIKANNLGRLAKYAVIVFAVMAALVQLGIASELVQILFAGIVITAALAFGLGGRDQAKKWLDNIFTGN